MKRFSLVVLAIMSLGLAELVAGTGAGFSLKPDNQALRWRGRIIKIAVSTSLTRPGSNMKLDSDVTSAVRRSLRAWQSVADIEFQLDTSDRQNVSPSGIAGDGVSLITIAQSPENLLLFAKDPQAEAAKTRVFFNTRGYVTEADIVLNPYQQFSTDGTFGTFDLESALTHEIGHLLGLGHSTVLSATMSNTLARNGTFGFADITGRTLAESDISAVRGLYGAYVADDTCCGTISGRLMAGSGKPVKGVDVWVEEIETGIVMSAATTQDDGGFRLGGIPEGQYRVLWQVGGEDPVSSYRELGRYDLINGQDLVVSTRIAPRKSALALEFVGINSQLAAAPVTVDAGQEARVFVGGKDLDADQVRLTFSSPFLTVRPGSVVTHDFGDGLSVVSFIIKADAEIPSGDYSIFADHARGDSVALIGAINVE